MWFGRARFKTVLLTSTIKSRRFLFLDLFLLVFLCRHIQGFTSFELIIRVMAFGFRFPSLWEGLGEGAKHSARRAGFAQKLLSN